MSAIAIGKTPPATIPAATRIATRNEKLVATAPASAASVTMSRHAFISRVLPKKSPIVPSAGCTRAYGNANAEESSAAVLTSTRRSAAICGITGSTARVNSVCANTTRPTIFRTGRMAGVASTLGVRLLGQPVEFDQRAKQPLHRLERHHVRPVGGGLVGVLVGLDEHAGDAHRNRVAAEYRHELALTARRGALPARLL